MSALPDVDRDAIGDAIRNLAALQTPSGSWKGDYSGPIFLVPLHVAIRRVVGAEVPPEERPAWIAYLRAVQNADGGFGLGEENPSTVFVSVLAYVALRQLGVPAHDRDLVRARTWFLPRGGALAAASWGRFVLCLLNLQPWEAIRPIPPELWLLPKAAPIHPSRMWCHSRMVYLPMAWLYARRFQAPEDDLVRALREEIHPEPWATIRWRDHRDRVAPEDAYTPRSPALRLAQRGLTAWERVVPAALRRRALDRLHVEIRWEDEATAFVDLGPVNKAYDLLVAHVADPGGPEVRAHLATLDAYVRRDGRGARVSGYDSSELWDTAFGLLALAEANRPEARDVVVAAQGFVDRQQLRAEPPDFHAHDRDPRRGGWPFSTATNGWPVTDCTAFGLLATLRTEGPDGRVGRARLGEAVDLLLGWQDPDGGFASYERTRGPAWLEALNPSDVFADIMVEHAHVECTSAVVQGLAGWRAACPGDRAAPIAAAVASAEGFLRRAQRPDGSWEGAWAACFTYGTWFGVCGLRAAGAPPDDEAVRRAVAFLLGRQRPDGSWGEDLAACAARRWIDSDDGQPSQTAWAVLALVAAGHRDHEAVRRATAWLRARQAPDGGWPPERILGVFNRTCGIRYDTYRHVFPLWALAAARA